MGSQRQRPSTGAGATQVLWCFLSIAAVPWTTVGNSEGDALHALHLALVDPTRVLTGWDPSLVNPCTWYHVTCNTDNHVTRVDLSNAQLAGKLVPQLDQLPYLEFLELNNNNISGEIPASLGNLPQLIGLDLYGNQFTGIIPATLGSLSQLVILRLNNNSLAGHIPLSLTDLNNLAVLDLSYNDLTGVVPVTGVFAKFGPSCFEGNTYLIYPLPPTAAPAPTSGA